MNPTTIDVPGLPPANTTYSQVSILGDLVFVSGQIGIDPATGRLADGGIQAQTRHAVESIDRCLGVAGTSLDKVAKVNLYLADSEWSGRPMKSTRSTSSTGQPGAGLDKLRGGALIEIEVVASR